MFLQAATLEKIDRERQEVGQRILHTIGEMTATQPHSRQWQALKKNLRLLGLKRNLLDALYENQMVRRP